MAWMRFSLSGLMAAVLIVGADVAALRAVMIAHRWVETNHGSWAVAGFAVGVLPMASLLVFFGLGQLVRLVRRGERSSFQVGFQFFGWVAVSVFVATSAIDPGWIVSYEQSAESWATPMLGPCAAHLPIGIYTVVWFAFVAVVFTAPELLVATVGGWLVGRRRAGERRNSS